ncbi:hypothetical protein [Parasitella parasitica]|uniref:Uncharacterized protein n=1 Tax=Parasitella parasitica TaxID=35722 RepID=A0A0B7NR26_9FUNG|nr:hypothetical protein [Parasitella parasitica]
MEDIHTNITDPRFVLETISHKQYKPKEDPSPASEKTKKSRANPNADHSLATRIAFMDRMLEQPGGARNAKLIRGNLGIHEKTAQELRKDWGCFYQEVNSQ